MRTKVDTSSMGVQVASVRAKTEFGSDVQKTDREGRPLSTVTCVLWPDDDEPQVVRVTVPTANVITFDRGDGVRLRDLVIADYDVNGKRGFTYSASAVEAA